MTDLNNSFDIESLSINNEAYIFTSDVNLNIIGFDAPIGSTCISLLDGKQYYKWGGMMTDWEPFVTTSYLDNYLSLSGGTLTGNLSLTINDDTSIRNIISNANTGANAFTALTLGQTGTQSMQLQYNNSGRSGSNIYTLPNSVVLRTYSAVTNGIIFATATTAPIIFAINSVEAGRFDSAGVLLLSNSLNIATGAGTGKVLTSDAAGNASWQTASSGDGWTYAILINDYTNNTTSFTDVTGLSISEISGDIYEVEGKLVYESSLSTTGMALTASFGSGNHSNHYQIGVGVAATADYNFVVSGYNNAVTSNFVAVANLINFEGLFMPTANGTWQLKCRSETAGQTITIKAGSFIKYKKIN
jgi:hypothetical protein